MDFVWKSGGPNYKCSDVLEWSLPQSNEHKI